MVSIMLSSSVFQLYALPSELLRETESIASLTKFVAVITRVANLRGLALGQVVGGLVALRLRSPLLADGDPALVAGALRAPLSLCC